MAKYKKQYNRQQQKKGVDLTHVTDTSSTIDDPIAVRQSKRKKNENYEEVEPPFVGAEKVHKPITWGEIGTFGKVIAGIATFFITIVIPVIWFASSIDTNVGVLQEDVKEVKNKTEELIVNSVRNSQRLDNLENNVSSMSQQMITNSINRDSNRPEKIAPNKAPQPTPKSGAAEL